MTSEEASYKFPREIYVEGMGIAKLSPGAMGAWKPKPVEPFKNE